jgi:2,3-bisphosphoglycerate-independent phosphoglycerate mutase
MSAESLTDNLLMAINEKKFDFIVVNYANPDMVGHTGDLKAAITAVETVDRCIGRLVN